jgi:hypothetical protein
MKEIFVFGSNEAGRHGAGAAHFARQHHGAIYGQGYGLQGDSFGIPTKDRNLKTLPLDAIKLYVDQFIKVAGNNPEMKFKLTAIGCGLAGYFLRDIAPFFREAPSNVDLPPEFREMLDILDNKNKYNG